MGEAGRETPAVGGLNGDWRILRLYFRAGGGVMRRRNFCGPPRAARSEEYSMAAKLAGGGGSKYALGQNADINVTPFVDIMLVLLIVMMVAVPVATLAIKVDLPPAVASPTKPKPPTFIEVAPNGSIDVFNGQQNQRIPTTLGYLTTTLRQNLGPDAATQSILIRADRSVRYGDFMAVVNQLQVEGFYKIALILEGNGTGK
jgi:biopolymer transport protein ExbD